MSGSGAASEPVSGDQEVSVLFVCLFVCFVIHRFLLGLRIDWYR